MIILYQLKPNTSVPLDGQVRPFILRTCQRTLVLSCQELKLTCEFPKLYDLAAYTFLLETITGLKSSVQAENEIMGQFKDQYMSYLKEEFREKKLIALLQDLLTDGKKVRTKHLMEIGQLSYAGLARKIIHQRIPHKKVVIFGSGSLALDVAKLLDRHHEILVVARNPEKFNYGNIPAITIEEYFSKEHSDHDIFVNTIGVEGYTLCDSTFFLKHHFGHALKLFIDLGSPCSIKTEFGVKEGIWRLNDIFRESKQLSDMNHHKILQALSYIELLSNKRMQKYHLFGNESLNNEEAEIVSWEELLFA